MATKTKHGNSQVRNGWSFPGRLAGRNAEVMAVGAWVEPEPVFRHHMFEAVSSAAEEEARLELLRQEKEERLRRFRNDVKQRVASIARMKKEEQLAQSCRAVEVERKVVCQSAYAAERQTPRKNRCVLRDDTGLAIAPSATVNTQGGIISGDEDEDHKGKAFVQQKLKVHQFTSAARRKLTSRRVITEKILQDELPGGVWKTGSTLDNPASRHTEEARVVDLEDEKEEMEGEEEEEEEEEWEEKENSLPRVIRFDPEKRYSETRQDRIVRKSAPAICGSEVTRVMSVPNIYPGVSSVEEKQRAVTQRAMYRRLFMDIEREQVKENQRARLHRKKIAQLKREKEEERRRQELESQMALTAKDPLTGATSSELLERQLAEEETSRAREEERRERAKKNVEAARFVEALKAQLKEKTEKQNVDLPALCFCGPTVWDTSPETCANNCVFYRNPKAYTRALQSLLTSCDVM